MIANKSSASTNDKSRRRSSYLRAQNFAAPTVKPITNPLHYSVDGSQSCRTNNIMFDARVCRGNTHANPVISEDQMRNREVYERTQNARRKLLERRRREVGLVSASRAMSLLIDVVFVRSNLTFCIFL